MNAGLNLASSLSHFTHRLKSRASTVQAYKQNGQGIGMARTNGFCKATVQRSALKDNLSAQLADKFIFFRFASAQSHVLKQYCKCVLHVEANIISARWVQLRKGLLLKARGTFLMVKYGIINKLI